MWKYVIFVVELHGIDQKRDDVIGCLTYNERKEMMRKLFMAALLVVAGVTGAAAQDWKSILSGVVQTVVSDKLTTGSSLAGTWVFVAPECQFESDNLLAKAGGEAVAAKIEEKLEPVYNKIGLDSCMLVFNSDSTYTLQLRRTNSGGTYSFDSESKTLTLKTKLGVSVKAHVEVVGTTMNLQFNADKLMSALQALTNLVAKVNSTASTVNSLAGNYDGLRLGFELKKVGDDQSVSRWQF